MNFSLSKTVQEFVFMHTWDEDYWKKPVAPPLDYPDKDDTDDTDTYQEMESRNGRQLVDSGIVGGLWYDIVDGKKIYRKFAGVNPPMEDI